MSKIKVLFLCTGNSCRSQLAEALLRHHGGEDFAAFSAGTEPQPIHPLTLQVLAERGISAEGLRSKSLREYLGREHFSYIVTVCDSAAQSCPTAWPGVHAVLHMAFEDPAAFVGDEQATLAKFRAVRNQIEQGVLDLVQDLRERSRASAATTGGPAPV